MLARILGFVCAEVLKSLRKRPVRAPVLMLNGRYDFAIPSATLQQPMLRLLGSPERDKRLILFETGHMPVLQDIIREVLNWLDRYIGPVNTAR